MVSQCVLDLISPSTLSDPIIIDMQCDQASYVWFHGVLVITCMLDMNPGLRRPSSQQAFCLGLIVPFSVQVHCGYVAVGQHAHQQGPETEAAKWSFSHDYLHLFPHCDMSKMFSVGKKWFVAVIKCWWNKQMTRCLGFFFPITSRQFLS